MKLFYSVAESAKKLKMTQDDVLLLGEMGHLQRYQDRDRKVFKVEQVDLLAKDKVAFYEAESLNAAGKPIKKKVLAQSTEDAIFQLKSQGLYPTSVRPVKKTKPQETGRTSNEVEPSEEEKVPWWTALEQMIFGKPKPEKLAAQIQAMKDEIAESRKALPDSEMLPTSTLAILRKKTDETGALQCRL